ncbi:MAG: hypothetical protein NTV34_09825 [Proteobacteria bacterium]|nr:hypothetical protein [Pseudomonadota bacterium]
MYVTDERRDLTPYKLKRNKWKSSSGTPSYERIHPEVQVTDTTINYEAKSLSDKDFLYQKYTIEGENSIYR